MKKTGAVAGLLILVTLIASSLAISSVPRKGGNSIFRIKQTVSLHVNESKKSVIYQLWENPRSNQDTLTRKESGHPNKSIFIPKTLSSKIKSDLLVLAWKSQYSQYRYTLDVNGPCADNIRIVVDTVEQVEVCPYQKHSFAKGLHIERNLNALFQK